MQTKQADNSHIIKLEKGESVIETLTRFCKENGIKNAHFTGIGAVEYVKCGYYALDEKQYHFQEYDQLVEVVSMTGNVMLKDGAPFIHVHGVFTDTSNNAFGGHIDAARVGITLEVILTPLSSSLERTLDDDVGLHLINCPD